MHLHTSVYLLPSGRRISAKCPHFTSQPRALTERNQQRPREDNSLTFTCKKLCPKPFWPPLLRIIDIFPAVIKRLHLVATQDFKKIIVKY